MGGVVLWEVGGKYLHCNDQGMSVMYWFYATLASDVKAVNENK